MKRSGGLGFANRQIEGSRPSASRWFAEPADNRVQSRTERLLQFGRQLVFDPACLAKGRPIHTATNDRWWPAVDDKTYDIGPNAFQNSV